MRVLLDENLDRRFKLGFDPTSKVYTVVERGRAGEKHGALLRLAAAEPDAFVPIDQNIEFEQNLAGSKPRIVVIRARGHHQQDGELDPALPEINRILPSMQTGELIHVSA